MKTKTAALLLCPVLLFGGQMLPVNAEHLENGYVYPDNGDTFNYSITCLYADENGNTTQISSGNVYYAGIIGKTTTVSVPDMAGYSFSHVGNESMVSSLKYSNGKISFDTSTSDITWFGSNLQNGSNFHLMNSIVLYYTKDPNFHLVPGWNQMATMYHAEPTWFYCNNDLSFATGRQTIDGKEYYFFEDGRMAQSEQVTDANDSTKARFYSSSGALKTGWIKQSYRMATGDLYDMWYYSDPTTGLMKYSGWVQDKGRWYHFDGYVMSESCWITESNGDKYYVTNSGAMATSRWITYTVWENDKNVQKSSYVNASGKMVKNQWVGQYWVGEDGAWVVGKTK